MPRWVRVLVKSSVARSALFNRLRADGGILAGPQGCAVSFSSITKRGGPNVPARPCGRRGGWVPAGYAPRCIVTSRLACFCQSQSRSQMIENSHIWSFSPKRTTLWVMHSTGTGLHAASQNLRTNSGQEGQYTIMMRAMSSPPGSAFKTQQEEVMEYDIGFKLGK